MGPVDIAVTSETRDLWFKSSYWQLLFSIECIEKVNIKTKRWGNVPIFPILESTLSIRPAVANRRKTHTKE